MSILYADHNFASRVWSYYWFPLHKTLNLRFFLQKPKDDSESDDVDDPDEVSNADSDEINDPDEIPDISSDDSDEEELVPQKKTIKQTAGSASKKSSVTKSKTNF